MNVGRPKAFDPDVALKSAMELFWVQGYDATSLQDLITKMGISKSSFYQTFENKELLFRDAIAMYRTMVVEDLEARLQDHVRAFSFIEETVYQVVEEASGDRRGCLLMNTACELGSCDPKVQAMVHHGFETSTAVLKKALELGVEQGDIQTSQTPGALASFLVATMGGMRNLIKGGADKNTIEAIAETALASVKVT